MSAVTVERYAVVDGERVPLSKCDWLHIAPCGCACGVHVAELNDMVVPSEDDAMIAFTRTETAREAERDRAAGFTVRLITHEQFCADESLLKCDHDPMWGVRKVAPPEGYKWAVRSGLRRQLYQHVAPVAAIRRSTKPGSTRLRAARRCAVLATSAHGGALTGITSTGRCAAPAARRPPMSDAVVGLVVLGKALKPDER